MRILRWIFQTLFLRSWLIIGGVAIGMLARILWPVDAEEPSQAFPEAAQKYLELTKGYSLEQTGLQGLRRESDDPTADQLEEPTLEELGNIPLSR